MQQTKHLSGQLKQLPMASSDHLIPKTQHTIQQCTTGLKNKSNFDNKRENRKCGLLFKSCELARWAQFSSMCLWNMKLGWDISKNY